MSRALIGDTEARGSRQPGGPAVPPHAHRARPALPSGGGCDRKTPRGGRESHLEGGSTSSKEAWDESRENSSSQQDSVQILGFSFPEVFNGF